MITSVQTPIPTRTPPSEGNTTSATDTTSFSCSERKASIAARKALESFAYTPANYNENSNLQRVIHTSFFSRGVTTLGQLMDKVDQSASNVLENRNPHIEKKLDKSVKKLANALAKNPEHLLNADLLSAASKDENIMNAVKSTALENPRAMKALFCSPFFSSQLDGENSNAFSSRITQAKSFIDRACSGICVPDLDKDPFSVKLLGGIINPGQALNEHIDEKKSNWLTEIENNPIHLQKAGLLRAACYDGDHSYKRIYIMNAVMNAALKPEGIEALLDSPFFKGKLDDETDEDFKSRCTQIATFIDFTCPGVGHTTLKQYFFPIALLTNLGVPTQALGDDIAQKELRYIRSYKVHPNAHKQLCEQSRNYPYLKPFIAKATAAEETRSRFFAICNCLNNGIVPKAAILTYYHTYADKESMIRLLNTLKHGDPTAIAEKDCLIEFIEGSKIIAEGAYGAALQVTTPSSTQPDAEKQDHDPQCEKPAVKKLFTNVSKKIDDKLLARNHAELNILQALQPTQSEGHEKSYFPKLLEASVVTEWMNHIGRLVRVSEHVRAKVDEVANKKFDKVKCRTWSKTIDASALVSSEVEAKVNEVANKKFGKEASDEKTKFMNVLAAALVDLKREGKDLGLIDNENIIGVRQAIKIEEKWHSSYEIQIFEAPQRTGLGKEPNEQKQFKKVLTGALHAMESRGININNIKDSNILAHKKDGKWKVQILRSTNLDVKLEQCERVSSVTMEKCGGVTLKSLIDMPTQLFSKKTQGLAEELNYAVQAMHKRGIYHGDLHAGNIIVGHHRDNGWQVKIIDFGLATKSNNNTTKRLDMTRLVRCCGDTTILGRALKELFKNNEPQVKGYANIVNNTDEQSLPKTCSQ